MKVIVGYGFILYVCDIYMWYVNWLMVNIYVYFLLNLKIFFKIVYF